MSIDVSLGQVVRLEPSFISVCTPNAIKSIHFLSGAIYGRVLMKDLAVYGTGTRFEKVSAVLEH